MLGRITFGYPLDEQSVQLKARIRPEVAWLLSETPLSEVQSLSTDPDQDGWCWLEAEVPNDQQTQWWIQGFGSAIDVIEPVSWREAIRRQAREVLGTALNPSPMPQKDASFTLS